MKKAFADRLFDNVCGKRSCVVVGIDPRLDRLPREILSRFAGAGTDAAAAAEAFRIFGTRIVEVVARFAVAVKPQVAFFERLGPPGFEAFSQVCRKAREIGLIVIADVKRNDIQSTALAYAQAYLGPLPGSELPPGFDVDAVTLTPYLGSDGIQPFVDAATVHGKGLFVLVRTSNKSAVEFQDRLCDGRKLYELVAEKVVEWGKEMVGASGYSSVGAVVGATWPEEARQLREIMRHTPFLVPGFGAQGAGVEEVTPCFDEHGLGAIVNASRSIIFAYDRVQASSWEAAVESAARGMRDQLRGAVGI